MNEPHTPARANQNTADRLNSGTYVTSIPVNTTVWIPVNTRFAVSGLLSLIPLVAMTLLSAVVNEAIMATSSANMLKQ